MNRSKTTNRSTNGPNASRESRSYFWIFEVVVIATVVPALYAGIVALNQLPVV